jgi:UDP:flavonoid glycosyltransferase YjiC (YdhE family)
VKVVLLALGSRGDVQPMVALGKALKATSMPVTVVALREFAPLVQAAGLSFMSIDSTWEESGPAAEKAARQMAGGGRSYQRAVSAWLAGMAHRLPQPRWLRSNQATWWSPECCRSTTR